MKKRILSIVLAICMIFMPVRITANAMSIYVDLNIIGETTLTLEVESGDSIRNVKEKIKNENKPLEINNDKTELMHKYALVPFVLSIRR